MLQQAEADRLHNIDKFLVEQSPILFPPVGNALKLDLKSRDERESFLIDVNRRGKIKLSKCTYQERYAVTEILVRLDIDGPPHTNPDGIDVACPHLHIYREGYGTKWAYPLPREFTDPANLIKTLRDFLKYCNVSNIPPIQKSLA